MNAAAAERPDRSTTNSAPDDASGAHVRESGDNPISAASSVRELKLEAERRGLDTRGCAEKKDLIALLACT